MYVTLWLCMLLWCQITAGGMQLSTVAHTNQLTPDKFSFLFKLQWQNSAVLFGFCRANWNNCIPSTPTGTEGNNTAELKLVGYLWCNVYGEFRDIAASSFKLIWSRMSGCGAVKRHLELFCRRWRTAGVQAALRLLFFPFLSRPENDSNQILYFPTLRRNPVDCQPAPKLRNLTFIQCVKCVSRISSLQRKIHLCACDGASVWLKLGVLLHPHAADSIQRSPINSASSAAEKKSSQKITLQINWQFVSQNSENVAHEDNQIATQTSPFPAELQGNSTMCSVSKVEHG